MTTTTSPNESQLPIFVVGVPRSGTTLLAAMLGAHSRLSCGPETHFFDQFAPVDVKRLCDPRLWPGPAVEYLDSVTHLGSAVYEQYGISRKEIEDYLRAQPPAVPAILGSITVQYRNRLGKQRWVDKTPNQCICVQDVRRFFPTAPVIRIVRDPRDVALSLQKAWDQPIIKSLWLWRGYEDASARFFQTDRYAFTLRYEDLLLSPEEKLKELCDFVGETYEPGMLDTSGSIKHVNKMHEVCKVKAGTAVDPTRIGNWQRDMTDEDNQAFEAVLGNYLLSYGYECRDDFKGWARIHPRGESRHYWPILSDLVSQRFRFWPKGRHEIPALSVYLSQPESNGWLPGSSLARLMQTAAISVDLWWSRLRGKSVYWFDDGRNEKVNGFCARVLRFSLKPSFSPSPVLGLGSPVCAEER